MASETPRWVSPGLRSQYGKPPVLEHQDYSPGMGIREDERTLPVKPLSQQEVLAAALSRIHHLERRVQALENR